MIHGATGWAFCELFDVSFSGETLHPLLICQQSRVDLFSAVRRRVVLINKTPTYSTWHRGLYSVIVARKVTNRLSLLYFPSLPPNLRNADFGDGVCFDFLNSHANTYRDNWNGPWIIQRSKWLCSCSAGIFVSAAQANAIVRGRKKTLSIERPCGVVVVLELSPKVGQQNAPRLCQKCHLRPKGDFFLRSNVLPTSVLCSYTLEKCLSTSQTKCATTSCLEIMRQTFLRQSFHEMFNGHAYMLLAFLSKHKSFAPLCLLGQIEYELCGVGMELEIAETSHNTYGCKWWNSDCMLNCTKEFATNDFHHSEITPLVC